MDSLIYPTFEIIEQRGALIPDISLPDNYLELIQMFYSQGRKNDIEDYAKGLEHIIKETQLEIDIRLKWDDRLGLKNISNGYSGLDLDESWSPPSFKEHNLGTISGFVLGAVAIKYVSELIKSQQK